jgi:glycosyltransferase involved in cell wall biosynthesis
MADQLIRLEEDPLIYQEQVEKGYIRSASFSWEKTAEELLSIYQSMQT